MEASEVFKFIGKIESIPGIFRNYGVLVPEEILEKLPKKGRFRTKGKMNGATFNLAIQSSKTHGKFLTVSADFLKSTKAKIEEPIPVSFELVSADELEIPEEFLIALEQDTEALEKFNLLTTGMKRSLSHYVSSAKQIDTRIKRSLELVGKIKTRNYHLQKGK